MSLQEGVVDSDGVAIHYLDWGGDGPPLLLIHATGFLAALWRPIAERLTGSFRVVAFDQRGHGESGKPADGYTFEAFAADLQRVIEALELERPFAAGHSSGATTIVVHAHEHPDLVRRAVLIEPILPRPEWYTHPEEGRNANTLAERARKKRSVWPDRQELFESYRSRETFASWREDMLRIYVDEGTRARADGQVELKCPPELEGQFFEAVTKVEVWPMLPALAAPTLLLWGANSHLHARGGSDTSAEEALPEARTVHVADASHFLPQERPDEVARLMEGFLAD